MRELRTVGEIREPGRLAAAARCETLEEVLSWGELVDVVVQDEFTHDVIVRAVAGFLVFDTT
jgi:hypothetical protein